MVESLMSVNMFTWEGEKLFAITLHFHLSLIEPFLLAHKDTGSLVFKESAIEQSLVNPYLWHEFDKNNSSHQG